MNDPVWSRSYWTVMLLAILLVPGGTYVAVMTTQSTAHVMTKMWGEIPSLPSSTGFFLWLGYGGIITIGAVSLLSIFCMATKRERALGTMVSAVVFAATLTFFLVAALASHFPFWCVTYRLSAP